jgi:hypothetical protein
MQSTITRSALLNNFLSDRDDQTGVLLSPTLDLWYSGGRPLSMSASLGVKSTQENIHQEAYRLGRLMLNSLGLPHVPLRFHKNQSQTDLKTVCVSTKVLAEESLPLEVRLDVFLGETIHEAAHILHTPIGKGFNANQPLEHNVLNIIEDERIERKISKAFAGYAYYLEPMKKYNFDYILSPRFESEPLLTSFSAFHNLVRLPKNLTQNRIDNYGEFLFAVKNILTPYPETFDEAFEAAKLVAELLEAEIKKDKEQQDKKEKAEKDEKEKAEKAKADKEKSQDVGSGGQGEQGEQGRADTKSDEKSNNTTGKQEGQEDAEQERGKAGESDQGKGDGEQSDSEGGSQDNLHADTKQDPNDNASGEGPDGTLADETSQVSEGVSKGELEPLKPEELAQLIQEIIEVLPELLDSATNPDGQKQVAASKFVRRNPILAGSITGEFIRTNQGAVFSKMESAYTDSTREQAIRPYVGALANLLSMDINVSESMERCQETGRLDSGRLIEAVQGSRFVYNQEVETMQREFSVVLLLDESGSMGLGDKMDNAGKTALLFRNALRLAGIPHFIYGHTTGLHNSVGQELHVYTDESGNDICNLLIYQEPNYSKSDSLNLAQAKNGNIDGQAIREVAKRVRSFTATDCLFFVISDGEPSYMNGQEDTAKAVKEISLDRFIPIQVSIESEHDPSTMFEHYVIFKDSALMVQDLGRVLRKAVSKWLN